MEVIHLELYNKDRERFLNNFEPRERGPALNILLRAERSGAGTVDAVVETVRRRVRERFDRDGIGASQLYWRLHTLEDTDLQAGARFALKWESLPEAERSRIKRERSTPYIEGAMSGKPPSGAQLDFLETLRYTGPEPADRAAASALIDEALRAAG